MDPVFTVAVGCALVVISALAVVVLRKPVHTALGLLAHSLSMAALYLMLDAQLMAMAQVLIYSGAIVVLFLIVVTLLPSGGQEQLGAGATGDRCHRRWGRLRRLHGGSVVPPAGCGEHPLDQRPWPDGQGSGRATLLVAAAAV